MPVGRGTRERDIEERGAKQEEKMGEGRKKTNNKGRMRNEWKERDDERRDGTWCNQRGTPISTLERFPLGGEGRGIVKGAG